LLLSFGPCRIIRRGGLLTSDWLLTSCWLLTSGCLLGSGPIRQKRAKGSSDDGRCCRNGRCSISGRCSSNSGRSRNAGGSRSDPSLRFRRSNWFAGSPTHACQRAFPSCFSTAAPRAELFLPGPVCNHISPFASCCRCQRKNTQTVIARNFLPSCARG
ncbi:unnamed protein product, partial [Ectocarpus sp. 13 AM-2016]